MSWNAPELWLRADDPRSTQERINTHLAEWHDRSGIADDEGWPDEAQAAAFREQCSAAANAAQRLIDDGFGGAWIGEETDPPIIVRLRGHVHDDNDEGSAQSYVVVEVGLVKQ